MNRQQRAAIKNIIKQLEKLNKDVKEIGPYCRIKTKPAVDAFIERLTKVRLAVEAIQELEEEAYDNMTDGNKDSDTGFESEFASEQLYEAVGNVQAAIENLNDIINY